MSRNLLPKYVAIAMAKQATETLKLSPPLRWQQVRHCIEPPLFGDEHRTLDDYHPDAQRIIRKWLTRESKRINMWRH